MKKSLLILFGAGASRGCFVDSMFNSEEFREYSFPLTNDLAGSDF